MSKITHVDDEVEDYKDDDELDVAEGEAEGAVREVQNQKQQRHGMQISLQHDFRSCIISKILVTFGRSSTILKSIVQKTRVIGTYEHTAI